MTRKPKNKAEEPIDTAEDCMKQIDNVDGTVFLSFRYGIYVSFENGSKKETAVLYPGKSYVNCSKLLGDAVPTQQELHELFYVGLKVKMDVVSQSSRAVPEPTKCTGLALSDKSEEMSCGWRIKLLWFGGEENKPDPESFNQAIMFDDEDASFKKRQEEAAEKAISSTKSERAEQYNEDRWFVVTLMRHKPGTQVPHPDDGTFKGRRGTIVTVMRPHGVIVDCNGEKVFVHRARIWSNGEQLSVCADLLDDLSVGMKVIVDYSLKEEKGQMVFENLPSGVSNIAVAMMVNGDTRPEVPRLCHVNLEDEGKFMVAEIVRMDPPTPLEDGSGAGYHESGIARILNLMDRFDAQSKFQPFVELDPKVKYVTFHRANMLHMGSMLSNADLSFFFSPMYVMNMFFCHVHEIPEGCPVVEYEGVPVKHRVTFGWRASTSFPTLIGQGSFSVAPKSWEDTLLFPRTMEDKSLRLTHNGREGLDIKSFEDMLNGRIPSRQGYMNGHADSVGDKQYYAARVLDLLTPEGNNGVSNGIVYIDEGPHAGQMALFKRSDSYCFGFNVSKGDLQYFMDLSQSCFVTVEDAESEEIANVRLNVTNLWIGFPPDCGTFESPSQFPEKDRTNFLLYLERHGLTVYQFMEIIRGAKAPRKYIPFRREENKGIVVSLNRHNKHKTMTADAKLYRDPGAVNGTILVEKGPLAGQLVTFHRRNCWIQGCNMAKADLTYVMIKDTKISLEALPITPQDRIKHPGLPSQHNYKATVVWTSSNARPRFDVDRIENKSRDIDTWFRKRGLTRDKFEMLINGRLPAVPMEIAKRFEGNLLEGGSLQLVKDTPVLVEPNCIPNLMMMEPQPFPPGPGPMDVGMMNQMMRQGEEAMNMMNQMQQMMRQGEEAMNRIGKMMRHGEEAVRICDDALSAGGPNDPIVSRIVKNDNDAQVAFHVMKALENALQAYKNKRRGGGGGGDSFGGFGEFKNGASVGQNSGMMGGSRGMQGNNRQPQRNNSSGYGAGYGQNSSGFGQNSSGYGQNSSGYGKNSSGFSQNSPGFGQNSSGYGPSSSGYGQNSSGYGQNSSGYGQNSSGYGQNSTGYGQSSSGYGAAQSEMAGPSPMGYGRDWNAGNAPQIHPDWGMGNSGSKRPMYNQGGVQKKNRFGGYN